MDSRTTATRSDKPAGFRRWPLWSGVVLLILTVLAWFAYQQRTSLFITAADAALQPYGLHVDTLTGLRLTTSALQIRELTLAHSASNTSQTLSDIDVGFTASGLIRGRINTISMAAAEFNVPGSLAGITAGSAPSAADILAAMPFDRLRVTQLTIATRDMAIDAVRVQNLSADLTSVQVSCQPSRCRLSAKLDLGINRLDYSNNARNLGLDMITFRSEAPVSATLEANTNTLSLATRSSTLTLPAIRDGDNLTGLIADIQRFNLSGTLNTASFDTNQLTAHTELSVRELYTNLTDVNLWSMQMDQHLTWQQGTVYASGELTHDHQRLLLNDLQHHVTTGTGRGTLETPLIEFNDNDQKLSDLLTPLPWQADVLDGSIHARARLSWLTHEDSAPTLRGTAQVGLNDISGYVNEIAFLRLSTDFAAELLPDWQLRSSRTASLSLAALDAGIEFTNIRSDYLIDSAAGSLALTDASLTVFGGTVSSKQLDYQLRDNDSRFTVVVDSIDLNQVLGMNAYQGVSANGLVSGEIPVRLQGLTPSISGGTLNALQPGGTIRYRSDGATTGNPASVSNQSLDLVYQALEHYRFNLMETKVDYQESGELDLAIRMEGISPELNGGQRINLNLNINDNVPALLQSLQAARSVTDSIQSRLDARQAETNTNTP